MFLHLSLYIPFFSRLIDYNFLKVFDCMCYHCLKPYTKHKLQACSTIYFFLGYVANQCDCVCLDMATPKKFQSLFIKSTHNYFSLVSSSMHVGNSVPHTSPIISNQH